MIARLTMFCSVPTNPQVEAVLIGKSAERFFKNVPPFDPVKDMKSLRCLSTWASWLAVAPPGQVGGVMTASAGGSGEISSNSRKGGDMNPPRASPLIGSGAGRWLDCCVNLAFIERDDEAAAVAENGGWYMPSIRMVHTLGVPPPSA